jgi:serine/threonine-protein kinase NIM1
MSTSQNLTSATPSTVETNSISRRTSLVQTRHHVNSTSAPTQNINKNKTNRNELIMNDEYSSTSSMPSPAAVSVSFAKDEKKRLTAYEKLLYDSQHDMRFKAEEKAGRRIGFYRIKGDIGLGNFSRVKLGVHLLAKGKV